MNVAPIHQARELATLLNVARAVSSTIELGPLLRLVLDQLKVVADYSGASISRVDGEWLEILESRGASAAHREEEFIGVRLPLARAGPIWAAIRHHEPVVIADVRGDDDLARAYRATTGAYLESSALNYVRSFLAVPLVHRDQLAGMLSLSQTRPGYYTPHHARLAMAIASHAAAAIEHARLYEQERAAQVALAQQVERLTTLTAITQHLLGVTDLDAVLGVVVASARRLSGASGAAVGLIEEDGAHIAIVASEGEPREYFSRYQRPALDEAFLTGTATGRTLMNREAVAVEDYAAWSAAGQHHELQDGAIDQGLRSFVVAPLLVDGAPIGVLRVHDTGPRSFSPEEIALVQALADQAALSIEHARLLRRSRDAAVLEERARLARDLHDSVTQSIFSVSMLARAAQTQLDRGSDRLAGTLGRIGALAQEALIEMRSLLFELQPNALTEHGLASALDRLVASMRIRTDLALTFETTTTTRPHPDVEPAVFRIVQEALGNALKHAQASEVRVTMSEGGSALDVTVEDNGVGFDVNARTRAGAGSSRGGMASSFRSRAGLEPARPFG
jgi:signal transduction histidine kinase